MFDRALFHWLWFRAVVRGWFCRWPKPPRVPDGFVAVSCACGRGDLAGFYAIGWVPWVFRRTARGGVSWTFLVRFTEEEEQFGRALREEYEAARAEERTLAALDAYGTGFEERLREIGRGAGKAGTR